MEKAHGVLAAGGDNHGFAGVSVHFLTHEVAAFFPVLHDVFGDLAQAVIGGHEFHDGGLFEGGFGGDFRLHQVGQLIIGLANSLNTFSRVHLDVA